MELNEKCNNMDNRLAQILKKNILLVEDLTQ